MSERTPKEEARYQITRLRPGDLASTQNVLNSIVDAIPDQEITAPRGAEENKDGQSSDSL